MLHQFAKFFLFAVTLFHLVDLEFVLFCCQLRFILQNEIKMPTENLKCIMASKMRTFSHNQHNFFHFKSWSN